MQPHISLSSRDIGLEEELQGLRSKSTSSDLGGLVPIGAESKVVDSELGSSGEEIEVKKEKIVMDESELSEGFIEDDK